MGDTAKFINEQYITSILQQTFTRKVKWNTTLKNFANQVSTLLFCPSFFHLFLWVMSLYKNIRDSTTHLPRLRLFQLVQVKHFRPRISNVIRRPVWVDMGMAVKTKESFVFTVMIHKLQIFTRMRGQYKKQNAWQVNIPNENEQTHIPLIHE